MNRPDVTGKAGLQRFLRLPAVLAATGWSRSTLYAKIDAGKFPAPVKLDPDGRAVGWPENDVLAHQERVIAARDMQAAQLAVLAAESEVLS
jgi:prophage regulatory protein